MIGLILYAQAKMSKNTRITQKDIEEWLEKNTFYCPALRARISEKTCKMIQKRPSLEELMLIHDTNLYYTHPRPSACDNCPRREKENEVERAWRLIKTFMEQNGITPEKMAHLLGITRSDLAKIEHKTVDLAQKRRRRKLVWVVKNITALLREAKSRLEEERNGEDKKAEV